MRLPWSVNACEIGVWLTLSVIAREIRVRLTMSVNAHTHVQSTEKEEEI